MSNFRLRRVPRRWIHRVLAITVVLAVTAPLTALAAHVFNDVPGSNAFHSDIEWLAESGVTRGCNPPANDEFCPDDQVTRAQMAAFMHRFANYLGAADGTPTAADHADKLDGKDASDFVEHGEIVTTVGGGGWLANSSTYPTEVVRGGGESHFGEGEVSIALQGPHVLGGVEYGLASITYCVTEVTGPAYVEWVEVWRTDQSAISVAADDTSRNSPGCYELAVNEAGGQYTVAVLTEGNSVTLGGLTARWLPASEISG